MMNDGWYLPDGSLLETPPDGIVGFVYRITRLSDGKFYIGKKKFTFKRTKTVKGKKKKFTVESDWVDYYGSSEELKSDVASLGKSAFRRQILHMCKSLSECNYMETKEIFYNRCLLDEGCYNSWVSCKIHKKHVFGKM